MTIEIIRTVEEVRNLSREAKNNAKRVALVPTMGGLHSGHMRLVSKAEEIADIIIVSLFVNPKQFNNPADLDTYPGNEHSDIKMLANSKTNIVFAPDIKEMYPGGFSTSVTVKAASNILCDAYRPGHFDGVATVIAKLFLQVEPDFACFGKKDYQQFFIIRKLVRDLNIPVEIIPVETVREADGLALSSRNALLSVKERKLAPSLNNSMQNAAALIRKGMAPAMACLQAIEELEKNHHFTMEYMEYRSGKTLELLTQSEDYGRIFAAAWLGNTRLIDNISA